MTRLVADLSMSLDGFITGPAASVEHPLGMDEGRLHAWMFDARTAVDAEDLQRERELRRLAHQYLRRERPGHLLQTTALVNEAFTRRGGPACVSPSGVKRTSGGVSPCAGSPNGVIT